MEESGYAKEHFELKKVFDPGSPELRIPGSDIRILNLSFDSVIENSVFSNQEDIFINDQRKNLIKSSIKTNKSRTIFEGITTINRAKL